MKGKGLFHAQRGLLPVCRGVAVLVAVLGILAFGIGGTAQLGAAEVQVIPPHPTSHDSIVLLLSGTWKDSCVPRAPQVWILGNHITIATSHPGEVCLMVLTPWQLAVPIGRLPGGVYVVTVTYSAPETPAQAIGRATFAVGEPLPPAPISGTTDEEGKFTVMLPWPGTTASGRLLGPDGRPLARRSFVLTPVPKGAALASPEDIAGFTFHAPGYAKTTVTRFSMFSLFGLTSFLLGDVQLAAVELPWSAGRPLTWDDFQGDPPDDAEEKPEAAEIHMTLAYELDYRVEFDKASGEWVAKKTAQTVSNTMDKSKSWVDPDQKTPELLNHEQKHFDLNEVYRRLLDAALCKLEGRGKTPKEAEEDLKKKAEETKKKHDEEAERQQKKYDEETDHGRNAEKQKEWDKKIGDWLADPSRAPQP